ncbi:MAG: alpha/beta fold hydrolase [Melioribacteraceae bacterium]|nr:alpha/beta fold hydrolase [Melioribacteraceae bacterium]
MSEFNPLYQDPPGRDDNFPSTMKPLIIPSEGEKLLGTLMIAQGKKSHPLIILLHGFPGNETNMDIAHAARRAGWNVLIFHYRGSWGSSGDYSFGNCIQDVQNVIEYMTGKTGNHEYIVDESKIVLAGHSLGGFAALMNLTVHDNIKNCAFLAGFNFGYVSKIISTLPNGKELTLERLEFDSKMVNNASSESLFNEMILNRESWDLAAVVKKLNHKNLLMIGAEYDNVAPIELHNKPLVNAITQNNSIKLHEHIIKAGHSFSDKRIELTSVFLDWLDNIKL